MLATLLEKVLKESVVVEEVQLRSCRAQFIHDRNGLQPHGHAPSRLPVKKF